jgi:hypothetical protein
MIEPKGIPITNEIVIPPVTTESDLPRSCGDARPAATASAVGMKTAAPHAASILHRSTRPKVDAATAALPNTNTAIAAPPEPVSAPHYPQA